MLRCIKIALFPSVVLVHNVKSPEFRKAIPSVHSNFLDIPVEQGIIGESSLKKREKNIPE